MALPRTDPYAKNCFTFTMKLSFSLLGQVMNAEKSDCVIYSRECLTVRKIIFTFLKEFIFKKALVN